jgi:hypothetical protein
MYNPNKKITNNVKHKINKINLRVFRISIFIIKNIKFDNILRIIITFDVQSMHQTT